MDVYVVSNCWWREGSTVIGAGAELTDAEDIADRGTDDDPQFAGWSEWKESGPVRRRDALTATGMHPSLFQEIARSPLAGRMWHENGADALRPREVKGLDRIAGAAASVTSPEGHDMWTLDRMREVLTSLPQPIYRPSEIRVGSGSARRWIEAQVEGDGTAYPMNKPWPTDAMTALAGIPVFIDGSLPTNVIKAGPMTYVLDTEGGPVPVGQAIAVDEDRLRRFAEDALELRRRGLHHWA